MIVQFGLESEQGARTNCFVAELKYNNDEKQDAELDCIRIRVQGDLNAIKVADLQGCKSASVDRNTSSVIIRPARALLSVDSEDYIRITFSIIASGIYRLTPQFELVGRGKPLLVGERVIEVMKEETAQSKESELAEPTYLTNLEDYLGKGSTAFKEPDFFRRGGPMWIDFEKGYVVRRNETDNIIDRLTSATSPISQMVVGGPASGKSTIARTVGYRLITEKGWQVFIIQDASEIGKRYTLKDMIGQVRRYWAVRKKACLLVIEDLHHNPRESNLVLQGIHALRHDLKGGALFRLLLVSRPTYKDQFTRDERTYLDDPMFCETTLIDEEEKAAKVAWNIIDFYHRSIINSTEEITEEEKNLLFSRSGKRNLWVLKYLLRNWEPGQGIDEDSVVKEVLDDLIDINKRYGDLDASKILISIAALNQYELPVEEFFIQTRLNLKRSLINEMAGGGDIIRTIQERRDAEGQTTSLSLLWLHHPALAQLYIKAAQRNHRRLGLQKKPDLGDTMEMIREYSGTDPVDYDVLAGAIFGNRDLTPLLQENGIREMLKRRVGSEQDLSTIEEMISLSSSTEFVDELLNSLDISELRSKIHRQREISKVTSLVVEIHRRDQDLASRLVESLDPLRLREKIFEEESIGDIGIFLHALAEVNNSFAAKVAESIRPEEIKARIEQEGTLSEIVRLLSGLRVACGPMAKRAVDSLDFEKFWVRVGKKADIFSLGSLLSEVAVLKSVFSFKLLQRLDLLSQTQLDRLKSSLLEEYGLFGAIDLFRGIAIENEELASKLLNSIMPELKAAIMKPPLATILMPQEVSLIPRQDMFRYTLLLVDLAAASGAVAGGLVDSIGPELKIEVSEIAETELFRVGQLLGAVAKVNASVADRLLECTAIELKARVRTMRSIVSLSLFLVAAAEDSESFGVKLIASLKAELKHVVQNLSDLGEVLVLLLLVAAKSEIMALRFVNCVSPEIQELAEKDKLLNLHDREDSDVEETIWIVREQSKPLADKLSGLIRRRPERRS